MAINNNTYQPNILVVNDDQQELNVFVVGLQQEDTNAQGCTSPSKAISIVEKESINVVLVDLMIPEMNGLQLARKLRQMYPNVITMLMSDYLLSPVQLAKADIGIVGFVPKPCRFHELASFIREKCETRFCREEDATISSKPRVLSNTPFDVLSVQFSV